MVSALRFILRVAHVVGAMALLALQVNNLIRTEPISADAAAPIIIINPLPALGLTTAITFNSTMVTEIIGTIVLIAGGANAALLKPRVNMKNTPAQSRNWRLMIYLAKFLLFLLATPFAKIVAKKALLTSDAASAVDALEIDRTAAAIRIAAILAGSIIGAYARFYREEATAASNAIENNKKK